MTELTYRAAIAHAIAREMERDPKVLLVGQPTRGLDIGAIEFIHRQLVAIRDAGCAILLVSVELDEVMSLADRILVMCGGRIAGEVPGPQADERTLGRMMANIWTAPGEGAEGAGGKREARWHRQPLRRQPHQARALAAQQRPRLVHFLHLGQAGYAPAVDPGRPAESGGWRAEGGIG